MKANINKLFVFILLLLFSSLLYAAKPSLRDKIGQMLIFGFQGKVVDKHSPVAHWIDKNNIGGVILFDYNGKSGVFDNNIESPKQVNALTKELQTLTSKSNRVHHRKNVPLIISIDYEGGKVNRFHPRYRFPEIPSAKTVGTLPLDEARDVAHTMTNTLKSAGINLNYSPVLDVDLNSENPVIGKKERSFSASPLTVSHYGQVFSDEFLSQKIQCSYKHFPGHGSSTADSHLGFVDVTDTWTEQELIPYLYLFSKPNHCGAVMVAHIVNRKLDASGVPASLSTAIISGLLRHELQFDGVVISDDMQMNAITNYYGLETAITLAINAGDDILVFGNQLLKENQEPKELIDIIERKVNTGEISEERINQSYERIIKYKKTLQP